MQDMRQRLLPRLHENASLKIGIKLSQRKEENHEDRLFCERGGKEAISC